MREVDLNAPWRQDRLDHWACLRRMRQAGLTLSPLFASPCLKTTCFLLDWMHIVDLGVAADVSGNLLKMCMGKYPARSESERCRLMLLEVQQYYRTHQVESRFDNITPRMIYLPGKPPKLKGKAAEVRYLVPFVADLADRMLSRDDIFEDTARQVGRLLQGCYEMLSNDH